ncbi:FHA domain-containing protein [candidate division KSB1 bacterium]|nr:FHA domain-containing protein [candidate division KSB1 bacterium]
MPKIVVKRKAEVYKEMPIRPFQNRITVGSEGDNDLILADKKISMHHLLIEKDGDTYYVTDTDSAFGTFINGERIDARTPITSGDEILLGEHTLQFENAGFDNGDNGDSLPDSATLSHVDDYEIADEDFDQGDDVAPQVLKSVDSQFSSSGKKPGYYLIAIYGPYIGKKYQLNGDITKIGRDKALNDIVIRDNEKGEIDPSISRRHATIYFENNELFISDKRSKTRTRVNQHILDEDSVMKLYPGDEIEIRSDQKGTIFRLVAGDEVNYAPPKKAGNWWIRNGLISLRLASAAIIVLAILTLVSSWRQLSTLLQVPKKLSVKQSMWLAESDPIGGFRQPEDVRKDMSSMTPGVADLNGDGVNDVVYVDKLGYLFVENGLTKQPMWPAAVNYRIQFPLNFVLADLNGNGLPDIMLPSNDSRIYAIDGESGNEIWTSPLIGGVLSGAPTIADINGDKIPDIFFCNIRGEIYIGYGTYSEPRWSNNQTSSKIRCTPSAGDFNGDGIYEIAVGTDAGELLIFNGITNAFSTVIDLNEEYQKAKGSFFEDHQIRGHLAIGDLDGDKRDDIVAMSTKGHVMAISGNGFKRLWFDELVAADTFKEDEVANIALGDLDNDKMQDVVIFTTDNKILAYRGSGQGNGNKKLLWGIMPEDDEEFVSHPVISDVNKDGNADVIAAGFFNGLYLLNGKSGKVLWQAKEGQSQMQTIVSTPLIADINADKTLDIFVRTMDEKFYLAETNAKVPKSLVWWGQINNDAAQTGNYLVTGMDSLNTLIYFILSIVLIVALGILNVLIVLKRKKVFTI